MPNDLNIETDSEPKDEISTNLPTPINPVEAMHDTMVKLNDPALEV